MALTVDVVGPAPWGFRISGGRDFHMPIVVTRVTEHSKAQAADLRPGDVIVAINGEKADSMLHAEAQSKIRQSPSPLRLQLDRSQIASSRQANGDGSLEVSASRFQAGQGRAGDSAVLVLPPSPGLRSSSPRFSSDSGGASHLLEEDSEVFKMLQENRESRSAPRQSSSFRLLQEALEAEERGGTPVSLPSSLSPQSSLPTARALTTPPKLHTCEKCGITIANQAVRIQEGRYRHPGCYSCADCGLNLKMRGHFWVGDELFCEKHARQRYSMSSPAPSLGSQA
ncbi:PDZ and LIM domain protein 2 isoform X2 [Ochotona curzoniae]|uniref:PDZ and LIM domain protein 2 isoform X2 n=1 Tax=Ochotona curzoniae TaxID=130825 RepID=UPI001B3537DD|nr:PDZ and LIM domain protein 2 isoform X2 [Ochotona curzoniae]